jgi:hypothetical protein
MAPRDSDVAGMRLNSLSSQQFGLGGRKRSDVLIEEEAQRPSDWPSLMTMITGVIRVPHIDNCRSSFGLFRCCKPPTHEGCVGLHCSKHTGRTWSASLYVRVVAGA